MLPLPQLKPNDFAAVEAPFLYRMAPVHCEALHRAGLAVKSSLIGKASKV